MSFVTGTGRRRRRGHRLPHRLHRRARLRAAGRRRPRRRAVGRGAGGRPGPGHPAVRARRPRHPAHRDGLPAARPRAVARDHARTRRGRAGRSAGRSRRSGAGRRCWPRRRPGPPGCCGACAPTAAASRGRAWPCSTPAATRVGEVTSGTFSPDAAHRHRPGAARRRRRGRGGRPSSPSTSGAGRRRCEVVKPPFVALPRALSAAGQRLLAVGSLSPFCRLRRLGQRVGHLGVALAHRLGLARRGVVRGLVLGLGVDLRAQQHQVAGQVEPQHQHDDAGDRAVGLVVGPEVVDVEAEADADQRPDDGDDDRAEADPAELRGVAVGRDPVEDGERPGEDGEQQHPADDLGEDRCRRRPAAARRAPRGRRRRGRR